MVVAEVRRDQYLWFGVQLLVEMGLSTSVSPAGPCQNSCEGGVEGEINQAGSLCPSFLVPVLVSPVNFSTIFKFRCMCGFYFERGQGRC